MSLEAGQKLAHYEILEPVGKGGMGEVYRAKDTKLGRDVAIKVLPEEFAQDEERLRRFRREAKVLAALSHPNIASIYGLEQSGPTHYLVLEMVEGETLADRIARGPIPVDEAVAIALKIAEALEEAHEQGIVHRDLKPANVKLTPDDKVKVLDFGLAKAFVEDASEVDSSVSPTITRDATRVGVLLGTAAYMSPEQAKGKRVDKRTDVFAFGAVLYEMLTGRRAFPGEDVSDTLAAVLRADVDMDALPREVSSAIRKTLVRCLEKNPKQRVRDMGDVSLALGGAFESGDVAGGVSLVPARRWQPAAVAALLAGLSVWALMTWSRPRTHPAPVTRFVATGTGGLHVFVSGNQHDLAVSPDGSRIVYKVGPELGGRLYERRLNELEGTVIGGTEGATSPFFSPDGTRLGFVQGNLIKAISVTGGAPVAVASLSAGIRGATWGDDGFIIFADPIRGSLYRVAAAGGTPEPLLERAAGSYELYYWPHLLPGGDSLLFSIHREGAAPEIALLDLDSKQVTPLVSPGTHPRYAGTGHIVYGGADGTVRALPFDVDSKTVTGDPVALIDGVVTKPDGSTDFAIADNGSFAYVAGGMQTSASLYWVERTGRETRIDTEPMGFDLPRLSPDGKRIAVKVEDAGQADIYVVELDRGTVVRLTLTPEEETSPLWSDAGTAVVFGSRGGISKIPADGSGRIERLAEVDDGGPQPLPHAWSRDRDKLVFYRSGGPLLGDIYTLDIESSRVEPLLNDPDVMEAHPSVSPDGRWLAYTGSDSGQLQVWVRPFPNVADRRVLVSPGSGNEPLWSHDGREIFYWDDTTSSMMVVPVTLEPTFQPGAAKRLFSGPYLFPQAGRHYDVSPDGQRFLMIKQGRGDETDSSAGLRIVFVENWFTELERRAPRHD